MIPVSEHPARRHDNKPQWAVTSFPVLIPGLLWSLVLVLVAMGASGSAKPLSNEDCLECHSDKTLAITNAAGRVESLYVDASRLAASIHHTNTCVSCHVDLGIKHPDDNRPAQPVDCARCHERESVSYNASVHGLAVKAGKEGAATCQDCHGTHDILSSTSPLSPLYFQRQAATCGACHDQEEADVAASVHGRATAAGYRDAPTCTDCHDEHQIRSLKARSPMFSGEVCAKCHASERINTKFNLPADRVATFFNSYHGLAAQYGSTVAADCSSCHGWHKILPSSDTNSTINKIHLVETCGKCHPGANENFALGKIHVDGTTANGGDGVGGQVNGWVRQIYLVLIFGTVGGMLGHNLLVFGRKVALRLRAGNRPLLRMDRAQRWQHALLAASFIVLAVTGFALKFPDAWISHLLGSSEPFRRWTHRISGLVLLSVGAFHLIYILRTKEGRRLVADLFPVRQDLLDVLAAMAYLTGLSREKPRLGRFGYAEKMEYWAVIWGTMIMGATGMIIWLKLDVTEFLPRWVVDVALTIHYYEAVLACLAIVVWHFYHVIFDPDVYPLNPACWDGRVSQRWQQEEHPLENLPEKTKGQ
jgi:formate dehydrogenase gamma subunit